MGIGGIEEMPIFAYTCDSCGHGFEKLRKSGEDMGAICPTCGGTKVRKEISAFASVGSKGSSDCGSGGSGNSSG